MKQNIALDKLTYCEIRYKNTVIPPPFSFQYKIILTKENSYFKVAFTMEYVDREQVTEEEILEEGFTGDDNYEWEGKFPNVWMRELKNMLHKSSWPKQHSTDPTKPKLSIAMRDEENEFIGSPANFDSWEYLLQEIIQAIYEISKKELPLELQYQERHNGENEIMVRLKSVFAERTIFVEKEEIHEEKVHKTIDWDRLKQILRFVYMPEYDYEKGSSKPPKKDGSFIDSGDKVWYELGKGVTNPSGNNDAISRIKDIFTTL